MISQWKPTDPNNRFLRNKFNRTILYLNSQGLCEYCGNPLGENWHVDHLLPWCKGGKTTSFNLKASCQSCNLKKGIKNMYTNEDYEKMSYFQEDFPFAKNPRECHIGAYNCFVERLAKNKEKSASAFLPTGTGKSDVIRLTAIGLVLIRKMFSGVWAFSPSTALKTQLKQDDIKQFMDRINYDQTISHFKIAVNGINELLRKNFYPFAEESSLDNNRFRNGAILESWTTQFLTTNGNIASFIDHATMLYNKYKKYPLVIFDETHLLSNKNEWGNAAKEFSKYNIPFVCLTGTPYRSDDEEIPGFESILQEQIDDCRFTKTRKIDSNKMIIERGKQNITKYKLKANYEYSYIKAWENKIILKPNRMWVDATAKTFDEALSNMAVTTSERILRSFLLNDNTIKFCITKTIDSIRFRKNANSKCAAIVTTLSDLKDNYNNEEEDTMADLHAKKIQREFQKQAPDLKVLVVTSKTNPIDGLIKFKTDETYDVLIVKAMGTVGFNCPRIKTVLHLSNHRTLPSFVQLANRGCRNLDNLGEFDLVLPKDKEMQNLWQRFENETGLELVKKEIDQSSITKDEIPITAQKSEKELLDFEDYNISHDHKSPRNQADEIIELINNKMPSIANQLNNQHKLNLWQTISSGLGVGDDWLKKMDHNAITKIQPLLDINEEEQRLRSEAFDTVKEITNEILRTIMKQKYDKIIYGNIFKETWNCVKRMSGLPGNQSIQNLCGIDNFEKIIYNGKKLKSNVNKTPENEDFDFRYYLKNFGKNRLLPI